MKWARATDEGLVQQNVCAIAVWRSFLLKQLGHFITERNDDKIRK